MCAVCATWIENQKERPGDRRAAAEPKAVRRRLEEPAGQGRDESGRECEFVQIRTG
jgi:hypothetical protein